MLINIFTPIFNFFFYSLSFITPLTFRTYNSFNGIFQFDENSLKFTQLMCSLIMILSSIILLYLKHKKELLWEYSYIFKLNLKYAKFNRFVTCTFLATIPLIIINLFKIKLFDKYDYFIFLISFLFICLQLTMQFFYSSNEKYLTNKKIRVLSLFDAIILFAIILFFTFVGTINPIFVVFVYLFLSNYSLRSISFVVLLLSLFTNLFYFGTNIFNFQYFNWFIFLESLIVVPITFLLYYVTFNTSIVFKKWFTSILLVITLFIYVIYL